MVEIRSEFDRVRGVKSLGQSPSTWYIFDRKRYGSRQKAVTAELKSRGTMYGIGWCQKPFEAELTNQRRASESKM